MASAIFFESRSTILATIQHNWQCISWHIIDSTKEFHVDRYENISKQDGCIYVHCYPLPVSRSQSYKVKVVLGVCCALIGQSHSSGGRIGSKIERAVNPFHPIFTWDSSDMSHVTIDPCTGQSAGSARANRIV